MTRRIKYVPALLALLLVAGSVRAQVSVLATNSAIGDNTFTPAELGGFSPTGADKLVVTTTDEGTLFSSITYDGQSLSLADQRANGGNLGQVWYLDYDGAATQGDLVVSGGGSSLGVSVLAMTNTAKGFVAKASALSTSISFDPLYNGSAVVAAFASNGDGDAIAQAPLTPLLNGTALGGGARGGSGWTVLDAGTNTFSSSVPNSRPAICVVSFAATGTDGDAAAITTVSAVDDGGNPITKLTTDPILALNFSESVFPGSGSILLKDEGGSTAQSYDVNSDSRISFGPDSLTITPDVLEPETSYFIQIPSGAIEDGSGNTTSYPDDTLTFSTGPWLTAGFRLGSTKDLSSTAMRGFDPSGCDKLILIVMGEGDTATSAAWGSSAMSNAAAATFASLWYLDGPFAGPDSLTLTGSLNGYGISLLALDGTEPGVAAADGSSGPSNTLTTSSDDSFVVAGYTANGGGNPAFAAPPLSTYFSRETSSSDGACGVVANSTVGPQTFEFTGNASAYGLVIAEFVKTPPPGGTLLICR